MTVRMLAVELAVRVDHLGSIQVEVHAELIHRRSTRRAVNLIASATSRPGGIVVSAPLKPAIIHHKQLDPHLGGDLGEPHLGTFIHVKERRFKS